MDIEVLNYGTMDIRTVIIGVERWWLLVDVRGILGLPVPSKAAKRLSEKQVKLASVRSDTGRRFKAYVVNRRGLVKLIESSDKKSAKDFQLWVDMVAPPLAVPDDEPEENDEALHGEAHSAGELTVFNYNEQEVRTVMVDNEPWWVLSDVCGVLGLTNVTQAALRLDEDERSMFYIGRQGEVNIINESGLYSVILRSNKPEAKAFRRWITHEVLPAIRKKGSYAMPGADTSPRSVETNLQRDELLIRAAEHKAVPMNDQLRLLDLVIRDLTGTGIDFSAANNAHASDKEIEAEADTGSGVSETALMDLPEVTGALKHGMSRVIGENAMQFYTLTETADMAGVSPAEFDRYAGAHGLKGGYGGLWVRVPTPNGEAREFVYLQSAAKEYRESKEGR